MSKRLALLGAQSALSIARPRGLGSSYGLIDRRPFPYQQISDLSKNSQMETTQDLKLSILISELKTSQEHHYTLVKREIQKLRHDMEIMQIEQRNFKLNYKSELGTVAWSSAPIGILCILMLYKLKIACDVFSCTSYEMLMYVSVKRRTMTLTVANSALEEIREKSLGGFMRMIRE